MVPLTGCQMYHGGCGPHWSDTSLTGAPVWAHCCGSPPCPPRSDTALLPVAGECLLMKLESSKCIGHEPVFHSLCWVLTQQVVLPDAHFRSAFLIIYCTTPGPPGWHPATGLLAPKICQLQFGKDKIFQGVFWRFSIMSKCRMHQRNAKLNSNVQAAVIT